MNTNVAEILRGEGISLKSAAPGRYYTTCPRCSAKRKPVHQREECLGVTIEDKKLFWGCNHCDWKGGKHLQAPRNDKGHAGAGGTTRVASYVYRQADGSKYLRVTRLETPTGKVYPQFHWSGREWVKGKPAGLKIPYRLPELIASAKDAPIFIAEGEKCADAVAAHGFVATTASEGAGKWRTELNKWFEGRTVYVLPDNDAPGTAHAEQVASNLHGIAREVRIVQLPGLGAGEDVFDWLERGNLAEFLPQLAKESPVWRPANEPKPVIIPSAQFVSGFVPPDYLVDHLLQRRFCYSNTVAAFACETEPQAPNCNQPREYARTPSGDDLQSRLARCAHLDDIALPSSSATAS